MFVELIFNFGHRNKIGDKKNVISCRFDQRDINEFIPDFQNKYELNNGIEQHTIVCIKKYDINVYSFQMYMESKVILHLFVEYFEPIVLDTFLQFTTNLTKKERIDVLSQLSEQNDDIKEYLITQYATDLI